MATITLRGYLEQLDTLLEQEALEEVIGHCRHILQYFPKNLDTYRTLGRALLEKARFDEAIQVFPRILSAVPSDFVAHVGLSQIYESRAEFQRALWHMERAYEQVPNNSLVVSQIRSLYEQMGRSAPEKIKMTRGALAKQYADSQMYDQAISELRRALSDSPQRVDLKILLARTLWQAGYPIESGEMALEILQILPDSLEANRLMAQLWIASKRPEDAQSFLKRVEALAPYESLKLIQEATSRQREMPDTAFTLERLDWSAATIGALASESPDWVSKIGDVFDIADGVALSGTADIDTDRSDVSPFDDMDVPDWVTGDSTTAAEAGVTASEDLPDWFAAGADIGEKPQTGELSAPEDWFTEMSTEVSQTDELRAKEADSQAQDDETGFTGVLDEIDEEGGEELDVLRAATAAPSEDEIAALLAQARGEVEEAEEQTEEQTPDWLGAGSEEPEWGDEFTPDWFTGEDDDSTITLTDNLESADQIEQGVSDSEFSAMFGEDDAALATLIDSSEGQTDLDTDSLFGTSVDSDAAGSDLSFEDVSTDDDLSALLGEEQPELDTDWLSGAEGAAASDDEFAAMFEEGGELSLDGVDEGAEEDDLSALLGEGAAVSDDEFSTMFEEGGELSLDGVDEGAEEDDLSALLGEGAAVSDDEFSTMFEEGGELSLGGADEGAEEDDLSALLGEEQPELDTGWLSGAEGAAVSDDEFATMFEEGGELSLGGADEDAEEDDLSALFEEEQPDLDTGWLSGAEGAAVSDDEFATMFEEGGELSLGGADDGAEEDDLSALLGEEQPELDTDWLSGAEGAAVSDDEFATMFEEGGELSLDGVGEDAEEDDLSALFEEEQPDLDTGWLSGAEGAAVSDDEFATMFEEGGELSLGGADEGAEEDDLSALLGEEQPELDTDWLSGAETGDQGGAPEGAEEEEMSALFESDASGMTGFLADAALDLIDEEGEEEPLEEREPALDTGWMTEIDDEDELIQAAEDIAAEPVKDTGELPDWLSVAPQEEVPEPEPVPISGDEDEFDALFAEEGLPDTGLFSDTDDVEGETFEEEEEEFDLNNLFRSETTVSDTEEDELSDIDKLLQETEVAASLKQVPDEDLFFEEEEAPTDVDEDLASLFEEDARTEEVDAEVSAVLSELFEEDEEDSGDIFDIETPKQPAVADVDDDELDDIFGSMEIQPAPESGIDLDMFELPEEPGEDAELLADLFGEIHAEAEGPEPVTDDDLDAEFDDLLADTIEEASEEDDLVTLFAEEINEDVTTVDTDDDDLEDLLGDVVEETSEEDDLAAIFGEETDEEGVAADYFDEDLDDLLAEVVEEASHDDDLAAIFEEDISALSEGELPGDYDTFDDEELPEPELVEEAQAGMEATEERLADDELFTALTTGSDMTEVVEDSQFTPEVDWVRAIGDEEMDTDFVETQEMPEVEPSSDTQFTFPEKRPRWMTAVSSSAAVLEKDTVDDDTDEDFLDFEDFEDDDILDDDDLDDIFSTDWME